MAKTYRLSLGARLINSVFRLHWVRNTRAAGEVTLSRAGRSEKVSVVEPDAQTAIPALRASIDQIEVTRPYFDAAPDSPDATIAAELRRHAVFRLETEPVQAGER